MDLSGGYTTRIVPQWRAEFPDYPVDDMPDPLPAGFVDHSWHNDDCPSFSHEATRTLLWWILWTPPAARLRSAPVRPHEDGRERSIHARAGLLRVSGETWLEVEAFLREYLPAAPTYPPAVDKSNQADAPLPAVVSYRVEVREILTYHFDVEASSNAEAEAKAMAAFKAIQDSAEAADMVEDRHAFAHESYKISIPPPHRLTPCENPHNVSAPQSGGPIKRQRL